MSVVRVPIHSLVQSAAIIGVFILALLIAGSGCTDSGSAIGPDDGDPNGDPDSLSFTDDVLPVFVSNCSGSNCHINAQQPASGLNLSSYSGLLSGSNSGAVVIPGNAQDSELIKRLEARSMPSMPQGRPLLPSETIEAIREWIDEGALEN